MGQIVTAQMTQSFSAQQTSTSPFNSGATLLSESFAFAFKNGVSADQINLISLTQYSFVSTTPQTATITALLDIFGNTCVFARVHLFAMKIYSTTDGAFLTLGNAAANKWTSFIQSTGTIKVLAASAVNPNAGFVMACAPNTTGYVVGAGTNEQLLMTPSAHAFLADLVLLGNDA